MHTENSPENSLPDEDPHSDQPQSRESEIIFPAGQNEQSYVESSPVQTSHKKTTHFSFLFLFLAGSGLLFIGFGGFFLLKLTPEETTDAELVEEIKNEIAPVQLPDIFSDQKGTRADNFSYYLKMVEYRTEEKNIKLTLLDFNIKLIKDKNQKQEFLNNFLMQLGLIPGEQENLDRETNEILIDSKPAEYQFKKGTNYSTGSVNYMIRGPIPGIENKQKELIFLTESEEDIEKCVQIIQSMKTKKPVQ